MMATFIFVDLLGSVGRVVTTTAVRRVLSEEDLPAEPYSFGFVVEDDENTVYANRQENQDADGVVQGEYSWVAANGIRYITSYTADKENGFNAVTREEQTDIVVKLPQPYHSDERQ